MHTFLTTEEVDGSGVLSALLFIESPGSCSWMFTTRYLCTLRAVLMFVPPLLRVAQLYRGGRPASANAKHKNYLGRKKIVVFLAEVD